MKTKTIKFTVTPGGAAMTNPSEMPTDWWAWSGEKLYPLGICEDFDEASDKSDKLPQPMHWIFSREMLQQFVDDAKKELG